MKENIWNRGTGKLEATSALPQPWLDFLQMTTIALAKLQSILDFVEAERETTVIYPRQDHIFKWAKMSNPENIKVVILGQDPYHGPDQATGLAFSVPPDIDIPPSLGNILAEVARSFNCPLTNQTGSLENWAEQGVLLLNSVLTVQQGRANSHNSLGWQQFTDLVIKAISTKLNHCVFLLWGVSAVKKSCLIDRRKHLVLQARHPSPLAALSNKSTLAPFVGCNHFVTANNYLIEHSKKPIDWTKI